MKLPNGFGTVYKIQHLLFLRRCSLRPVIRLFFFLLLWIRLISYTLDILARAILTKRFETTDTTFRNFEIVHNTFPFCLFSNNKRAPALGGHVFRDSLILLIQRGIVRVILCVQRRELVFDSRHSIRVPAHGGVKILRA